MTGEPGAGGPAQGLHRVAVGLVAVLIGLGLCLLVAGKSIGELEDN
jgi:hypothetical protein